VYYFLLFLFSNVYFNLDIIGQFFLEIMTESKHTFVSDRLKLAKFAAKLNT
jgi:hypothetical protein